MSEPAKIPAVGVVPMRVNVRGRVERMRRYEGTVYTTILTPAKDEYSRPNSIEIRSKGQVGAVGDDVNVFCLLGGFSERPRKWTNTDTGEVRTIHNVRMFLDLVD